MTFLVLVLVALVLRFTPWHRGFPLDVLGQWAAQVSVKTRQQSAWQALLLLAVPLLLAAVVLLLVDEVAYGILTLVVHTLLLLCCVSRTHPLGSMTAQFEQAWQRGDIEAASLVAERDMDIRANSPQVLLASLRARLVWEVCHGYLVPAFWYLLLGPLGAMAYRLLQQFRSAQAHPLLPLARTLAHALEWLPARLMGLSMALVGQFERTLSALREDLMVWEVSAERVTSRCAEAALATENIDLERHVVMHPVRRLLERSMLVWAVVIALLSLLA